MILLKPLESNPCLNEPLSYIDRFFGVFWCKGVKCRDVYQSLDGYILKLKGMVIGCEMHKTIPLLDKLKNVLAYTS